MPTYPHPLVPRVGGSTNQLIQLQGTTECVYCDPHLLTHLNPLDPPTVGWPPAPPNMQISVPRGRMRLFMSSHRANRPPGDAMRGACLCLIPRKSEELDNQQLHYG